MPHPVHIIVVPTDEDGLRRTFADTHRRYTGFISARKALDRPIVAGAV